MARLTKLNRSVAGRVAIITGAASGMGRATAMLFADEGARVAICDRSADALTEVESTIAENGGDVRAWTIDVSDAASVNTMVAQVHEHFGAINILVNNAGVSLGCPIDDDHYDDAWARTLAINLTAHTHFIRACLPHLQAGGDGRIVNVASTEGLGATAGNSPYTASKHGVVGLTRSLAVELGKTGVTVNCVCPGPIHTGMTASIPDEHKEKFARRRVPLRRYGDPEEVAQITLSVALPAASYLNGVVIQVDGGMMAQNT